MHRGAEGVLNYHERTKHTPWRYARSPETLDWENQPAPFRRYVGARAHRLPFLEKDPQIGFNGLFTRAGKEERPFVLENTAAFLELSLALSAWKSYQDSTWALRINPSSGNLHPTEAYLVLPAMGELPAGVFHYNPYIHSLEERADLDEGLCSMIRAGFGIDGFLVGLTSIFWREAWKYGERAFRYCALDIGHAASCMSFSANLLGWKATLLDEAPDSDIARLLGLKKTRWLPGEAERPEALLFVHKSSEETVSRGVPAEIANAFDDLHFSGEPNPLSEEHREWQVIDEVSRLAEKPVTAREEARHVDAPYLYKDVPALNAAEAIRKRRSAQAYDGKTPMPREVFFAILDRTIPRPGCAPFDMGLRGPYIHLLLFVHRVEGLEPGIYFLLRHGGEIEELRKRSKEGFLWERPVAVPKGLPLYLLEKGDLTSTAATLSCRQDIAGTGAFSTGMIARFRHLVEENPYLYRRLHWEAGAVGQVLYIASEGYGFRGTGIGCFFDDSVHETLGLTDDTFQSVYHFTVGTPIEDRRMLSHPAYHHLKGGIPGTMSVDTR